ncbi:MAG: hypothetical protein KBS41_01110 [Oscillospiraceae bacterium]|nr:hypothetical protein [Candidatus Equicaccousia limihippi]
MALSILNKESTVEIKGDAVSENYITLTAKILRHFGAKINKNGNVYTVGECTLKGGNFTAGGDWSAASCFFAAAVLGGDITLSGLGQNSLQPDCKAIEIFENFGVKATNISGKIKLCTKEPAENIKIDISQTPDLFPAVCVAATKAEKTEISGVSRLRFKESDRLLAMQKGLAEFGINSSLSGDVFTVYGGKTNHKNRTVQGCGDHRIVMAFSVLAAFCEGKTEITNSASVSKSYPEFFNHFKSLGGICFE